jgi:uncharacterized protein (DUF305 family)
MRMQTLSLVLGTAMAVSQLGAALPAAADAMTSPAPIDCSKASAMMGKAMPATSMDSKMTVDQQYASAMMAGNKAQISMAKIELQCGKDGKARAMAKKMLDSAMSEQPDLDELTKHSS